MSVSIGIDNVVKKYGDMTIIPEDVYKRQHCRRIERIKARTKDWVRALFFSNFLQRFYRFHLPEFTFNL